MGNFNNTEIKKRLEKLKEDKCPICDHKIISLPYHKPDQHTFDYQCRLCSPSANVVISISGSVLNSERYNKILKDNRIKLYLMEKIWNCKETEIEINCLDVE